MTSYQNAYQNCTRIAFGNDGRNGTLCYAPYQLREALNGGGFDAALDVEIVLRHVYLRVTGKGQPNALAMRLNVRAAKLKNDYGIHYENTQAHAGRIILLTKISPGA